MVKMMYVVRLFGSLFLKKYIKWFTNKYMGTTCLDRGGVARSVAVPLGMQVVPRWIPASSTFVVKIWS